VEDWNRRDLRILEIVAGSESRDADGVRLSPLAKQLDLEETDLRHGFEALKEAGYISFERIVRGGMGGTAVIAPRLREKGRRTLKLWPGNSFEALIDVLEQRIREEPEPEKRSRLQGLLAAVRAVGGPALAEILAKLVEHQIGMPFTAGSR